MKKIEFEYKEKEVPSDRKKTYRIPLRIPPTPSPRFALCADSRCMAVVVLWRIQTPP